jgi:hypothetical protein
MTAQQITGSAREVSLMSLVKQGEWERSQIKLHRL